jgi:tetratricopeptide (TPR) repeat protein
MRTVRRTRRRATSVRFSWSWIFVLIAVSFGIYANSLTGSFVSDDMARWQDAGWIQNKPLSSVIHGLFAPQPDGFYRPIPYMLHVIDYHLWGLNPLGFHLTNVLLHTIATILVYLVALRLLRDQFAASVTALLFATHPVHTEAVTWIAGRTDVVMAVFFLLSFLLYMRFRDFRGSKRYAVYGGSVLFFVLALMSKEAAVALPLVLLFYEACFQPRRKGQNLWKRFLYPAAPSAVLALAYLSVSILGGPGRGLNINRIGLGPQALTAARAFYEYLGRLLVPVNLRLAIGFSWSRSFLNPDASLPLVVLVLFVAALIWSYRHAKIASFGLAWIALSILPISNLFAVTDYPLMAEHYLYVPSVGFCLALGFALRKASNLPAGAPRGRLFVDVGVIMLVAIVVSYSFLIVRRNRDWSSLYSLAKKTVEQHPFAAQPRIALARAYLDRDMYAQAIKELERVLRIDPENPAAYDILGMAHAKMGEYEKAIQSFRKVIALEPSSALPHYNLGLVYYRTGQIDEAISEYEKALEINLTEGESPESPSRAKIHINLANLYLRKGQADEAISQCKSALAADPDYPETYANLGSAYMMLGKVDEAISEYNKALHLSPSYAEAYFRLGNAYMMKGSVDEAISEYMKALVLNPRHATARLGLANAYLSNGAVDQAISEYEAALSINPRLVQAHVDLAGLYCLKGRHKLAILHCEKAVELGGKIDPEILEALSIDR